MKTNAPVILFAFTRISSLKETVKALQSNYLASQTPLFVYIDKAENPDLVPNNTQVKDFVKTITGFQSVKLIFNKKNKGLDTNVIDAVSEVLKTYDRCICVEDDIITTPNFLDYMNQALDFYQTNSNVMSIGAYGYAIKRPQKYVFDAYSYDRGCSWGWGTWRDRWQEVDWSISDVQEKLHDKKWRKRFNHSGSDMIMHLKRCIKGGNMWDIRFHYHHFNKKRITIYPFFSLAQNIGFGDGATHCKEKISRFKINLSDGRQRIFKFPESTMLNPQIHKEVYYYNSLRIRIIYKIFNKLFNIWKS